MSIKLYMNHHVDVAITEGLRRRGVDVSRLRGQTPSADLSGNTICGRSTPAQAVEVYFVFLPKANPMAPVRTDKRIDRDHSFSAAEA